MVRLKEKNMSNKEIFELISIPYGAIKSITRNTSSSAPCKISIPYGAIKSTLQLIVRVFSMHFNSLWCD